MSGRWVDVGRPDAMAFTPGAEVRIEDRWLAIFRLGSDTRTFTVADPGVLRLCIYHGMWASKDGVLKPPVDAYAALEGGFDVLVIRWGDVSPSESLDVLSSLAPEDPLIATERTRLATPREPPPGFEPLWFVGRTDIFSAAQVAGLRLAPLEVFAQRRGQPLVASRLFTRHGAHFGLTRKAHRHRRATPPESAAVAQW